MQVMQEFNVDGVTITIKQDQNATPVLASDVVFTSKELELRGVLLNQEDGNGTQFGTLLFREVANHNMGDRAMMVCTGFLFGDNWYGDRPDAGEFVDILGGGRRRVIDISGNLSDAPAGSSDDTSGSDVGGGSKSVGRGSEPAGGDSGGGTGLVSPPVNGHKDEEYPRPYFVSNGDGTYTFHHGWIGQGVYEVTSIGSLWLDGYSTQTGAVEVSDGTAQPGTTKYRFEVGSLEGHTVELTQSLSGVGYYAVTKDGDKYVLTGSAVVPP